MVLSRLLGFFKDDRSKKRDFNADSLAVLVDLFRGHKFEVTNDPLLIKLDGNPVGLSNVYSKFLNSSGSKHELRELSNDHFLGIFEGRERMDKSAVGWDEAEKILFPQLIPVSRFQDMPIVTFPFKGDILIGFVLDFERSYQYVTEAMFDEWQVDRQLFYDTAIENLAVKSEGLDAEVGAGTFIAVNTGDGFDATRIIVPDIQELVKEQIGSSFCFGIPNRDALLCWAKPEADGTDNEWRTIVSLEFASQPYPISGDSFHMDADGVVTVWAPKVV